MSWYDSDDDPTTATRGIGATTAAGDSSSDEDGGGVESAPGNYKSRTRRMKYTTFGNDDDNDNDDDDDVVTGQDRATYGSFLDAGAASSDDEDDDEDGVGFKRRKRTRKSTTSRSKQKSSNTAAPLFVKGKNEIPSAPPPPPPPVNVKPPQKPTKTEPEKNPARAEHDNNAKKDLQEEEKRRQQADEYFFSLLNKARGAAANKRKRPEDSNDKNEIQQQLETRRKMEVAASTTVGQSQDSVMQQPSLPGIRTTSNQQPSLPPFASFGRERPPKEHLPPRDPNLGKWEKHTKGIGMKLLMKMGYKGSGGLGRERKSEMPSADDGEGKTEEVTKEAQLPPPTSTAATSTAPPVRKARGISRPVEVVVRPANLGLGFGNFQEASKLKANRQIEAQVRGIELPETATKSRTTLEDDIIAAATTTTKSSSSALPSMQQVLQQQSWKRGAKQRKQRGRTVIPYTELLEETTTSHMDASAQEVSTGTVDASQQTPDTPPLLAEELLHNVQLLLNTYENKVHSASSMVRSNKNQVQHLQGAVTELEQRHHDCQDRIIKLGKVLEIIDQIDELMASIVKEKQNASSLDALPIRKILGELASTFSPKEQETIQLHTVLIPSLISPIIEHFLSSWQPLVHGKNGVEDASAEATISSVMALVQDCVQDGDAKTLSSLQEAIFLNHVVQHVRKALTSVRWDPVQHTESALNLVETLFRVARKLSPATSNNDNDMDEQNNFFVLPTENNDAASHILVTVVEEEIVEGIIYPKLSQSLSQWRPEMSTSDLNHDVIIINDRLDLWLLPWFPYLDRPNPDHPSLLIPTLLSDVKRHLRSTLTFLQRQVSSSSTDDVVFIKSCLLVLQPWKNLLKTDSLHAMTAQSILPRFARALSRMTIHRSAHEQDWTLIDALWQMKEMRLVSDLDWFSLMEGELLTHWAITVHQWLSSAIATPNHDESIAEVVAENYVEWKIRIFSSPPTNNETRNKEGMLKSSAHLDERICRIFYSVLCMIQATVKTQQDKNHDQNDSSNHSLTLDDLKPIPGHVNFAVVQARRLREQRAAAKEELERMNAWSVGTNVNGEDVLPPRFHRGRMDATFREVVEAYAKEHDLLLLPRLQGDKVSSKDGKPIFLFGSIPIYMDSNVVFVQKGSDWRPMSLEQLATMAVNSNETANE